ncbi:MAG: hypothetical protein GYB42_09310 [Alphaproteobacteria bacterium]|nr:hypothetical protein [Alphaproteobacteria bacterium]
MADQTETKLGLDDVAYFASHQSPEFDEVVLQGDYASRAALSFYRFRQLGGGRSGRIENGRAATGRGIHYVSDHPDVRIFHLSVIALLILFESAANAYFFAQQSEFGLFGGLFQAAAVSLANVATSYFIIGYWGLRHVTTPASLRDPESGKLDLFNNRNMIKLFGFVAIILGIIMVLLVNLSAAHYRNILDLQALGEGFPAIETATFPRFWMDAASCQAVLTSEIGDTIGSAATNAMCRPFALHSLDAMVLFALGLAISCLAAFEGRRADAPYPGFSDAARQFERARRDVQDALDDYYDSFEDIVGRVMETQGDDLSKDQKMALRLAMDDAVLPYKKLLTTNLSILEDEFQLGKKIVEKITSRKESSQSDDEAPYAEEESQDRS